MSGRGHGSGGRGGGWAPITATAICLAGSAAPRSHQAASWPPGVALQRPADAPENCVSTGQCAGGLGDVGGDSVHQGWGQAVVWLET